MSWPSRVGRWLWRRWYFVVGLTAAVAMVIVAWTWAGNESAKRDRAERDRKARGEQIVAQNDRVIECTTPGMPCYEEAQKRSRQTLGAAFLELDCVFRRAIAGQPAIDPAKGPCAAQTPRDVYPG